MFPSGVIIEQLEISSGWTGGDFKLSETLLQLINA